MKSDAPKRAEKEWREEVRQLGPPQCHIHHCAGRTARHNKVAIGHWWVLPLSEREHRAIHQDPMRKEKEKILFGLMLAAYTKRFSRSPPVPAEVLEAIRDWHR